MEHNDIRHKLSDYLDGSITTREKTELEEHLRTCIACSDALRELQKTIEHIKTAEEVEPPAWMTQKIMAKVRSEAEQKKGLFERLFYPLSIKLPVQAIAVLFLAVTGFYVYQNVQPANRVSEPPIQEFAAAKQAPQADTERDTLAKADRPAPRSRQVPQTPAYKALDMKQEYVTPPPPMPQDRAAEPVPVPVQPAAEAPMRKKAEVMAGQHAAAPQAAAPILPQEQTVPIAKELEQGEGKRESAFAQKKFKSAAAQVGASLEGTASETTITISVKDMNAAGETIEAAIREFDGTIISSQRIDAKRIYRLSLNASHANDLIEKLKRMGSMKEKNLVLEPREDRIVFKIELTGKRAAAVGC